MPAPPGWCPLSSRLLCRSHPMLCSEFCSAPPCASAGALAAYDKAIALHRAKQQAAAEAAAEAGLHNGVEQEQEHSLPARLLNNAGVLHYRYLKGGLVGQGDWWAQSTGLGSHAVICVPRPPPPSAETELATLSWPPSSCTRRWRI